MDEKADQGTDDRLERVVINETKASVLIFLLGITIGVAGTLIGAERYYKPTIAAEQRSIKLVEAERSAALEAVAELERYNTDSLRRVDQLKSRQAAAIVRAQGAGDRISSIRAELEAGLNLAKQYEDIIRGYGFTITRGKRRLPADGSPDTDR